MNENEALWPHFFSGALAGFINVTLTFPINKVIFRQQINGVLYKEAICQIKDEGWKMVYRGVAPPLYQKSLQVCMMYGLYETFYKVLEPCKMGDTKRIVSASVIAGLFEAVVACPFERGQSLLQTPEFHGKIKNTWDLRHHLKSPNGRISTINQWYRGFSAIVFRNCSTTSLFFLLREPLRDILPEPSTRSQEWMVNFLCGAVLGATNSTIIYPVNVIKSHQQKQITDILHSKGFFSSGREVLKERGLRKMYCGAPLNVVRSLISWGIINATYEVIIKLLTKHQGYS